MEQRTDVPVSGWTGVQRRVRRLVPRPIRRADLAVFRAVARTRFPLVGPLLPRLSNAANHSRLWMAVAALLAATGGRRGRRGAGRGLLAVGVTSALTNLPAKLITGRVRPDLAVVPEIRRLARVPASTSFPSGHSASAFAFAVGASLEEPRVRAPLLALAGAVATSRVYTGVHYPGDAIVGSAIGVAVARATTRPWPVADRTPATAAPPTVEPARMGPDGEGLTLVANPAAGRRLGLRRVDRVRDALPAARVVVPEEGQELHGVLEAAAEDASVLGIAGGDGSVSTAGSVAQDAEVPLAVVPTGTLNHFAKDIGIEDEDDALGALRGGRVVAVDVGDIGGRRFINAASVGAYPTFVRYRRDLEGRLGKFPAMVTGLVRSLRHAEPLELEIDGRHRRVWLLFVGNSRFSVEGLAPARRGRLDDGLLDVRVVSAERPWSRTRLAVATLTGRLPQSATYERWTAPELEVRSLEGPLVVARDGEIEPDSDRFTVTKHRRSLLVLQPLPAAPTGLPTVSTTRP